MILDEFLRLCRAQPGATEGYPFDMDTLVFRVMGKIFALTNEASLPERVTLKCEPDLALALRDQFAGVVPGYHTNKRHWNTVYLDRAAQHLNAVGTTFDAALLAHLSPMGWAHISLTGDYLWEQARRLPAGEFHPLNEPMARLKRVA